MKEDRLLHFRQRPPRKKHSIGYRFKWNAFDAKCLLVNSSGEWACQNGGKAGWHRACHGCNLEALFSAFMVSRDRRKMPRRERNVESAQGVYAHRKKTPVKADIDIRHAALCDNDVCLGHGVGGHGRSQKPSGGCHSVRDGSVGPASGRSSLGCVVGEGLQPPDHDGMM